MIEALVLRRGDSFSSSGQTTTNQKSRCLPQRGNSRGSFIEKSSTVGAHGLLHVGFHVQSSVNGLSLPSEAVLKRTPLKGKRDEWLAFPVFSFPPSDFLSDRLWSALLESRPSIRGALSNGYVLAHHLRLRCIVGAFSDNNIYFCPSKVGRASISEPFLWFPRGRALLREGYSI